MALITWPTYQLQTRPPVSVPVEIQSASIQLQYPGRRTVKAQFTNREQVFDVSDGEWAGSVTLAAQTRNSDAHRAIQVFLAELNDNPGELYTELPWDKPSIFTIASTWNQTSPIHGDNNEAVALMQSITGSVGRIGGITATSGETIRITAGEHFGYRKKTYRIITATEVAGTANTWDVQTAPALPNSASASSPVFKRNALPCRITGGQNVIDPTNGRAAGPWQFTIIEEPVD